MLIRRVARPMLATTFIARGVDSLRSPKTAADAARPTLEGLSNLPDPVSSYVPSDADTVAKATAAVQIGAGLLLATGKLPRFASAALAVSVVPGSLGAHAFWNENDPERKATERKAFFADISLIGGLIIASVDTEGKPSLGWRGRRAARKVSERVSGALPSGSNTALIDSELVDRIGDGLQSGLHVGAERGRELAHVALERGSEFAELARERAPELADLARERSAELAEVAQKRGSKLVDVARDRAPEIASAARDRSVELADVAQKRGSYLVDVARDRSAELAELASDRSSELANATRAEAKRARKEVKRARKELKQRTG
ncbi:DoxX family membrane protein [Mycolicibacterium arenosum]|uniref:DoxX family protein n=1 Tax=Mycolicibacterium arenosum TaxID=2952157 RepID=A0ABT1MA30_9MYCO|nr:DoxX family membrane protein [Mycolicibacterium sp. CAU 1645]MCP9276010.1 DoxX family protein [Mycolicibacterium sp. CAU 1645]